MSSQLVSFVKESLEKGLDRNAIREVLLQAGWQEDDVKNALSAFAEIDFPVPVPRPKPYLQAREAFLYLLSFIALYVSAVSFTLLVFSFIDRAFPDPLSFDGDISPTTVASIIVAFPLYLLVMWRLSVESAADPERRRSKIRKWLTYLTLIIGAGIIITDLIALLSNLLEGDLTIRIALKVLTIGTITGCIFGYYLWDLQQAEKEPRKEPRR